MRVMIKTQTGFRMEKRRIGTSVRNVRGSLGHAGHGQPPLHCPRNGSCRAKNRKKRQRNHSPSAGYGGRTRASVPSSRQGPLSPQQRRQRHPSPGRQWTRFPTNHHTGGEDFKFYLSLPVDLSCAEKKIARFSATLSPL